MNGLFYEGISENSSDKVYSVEEYLEFLNALIRPAEAYIQGEVISVTERGSAVYFTISDKNEKAVLPCLIWKNRLNALGIELKEGDEIKIHAFPQVYKPSGRMSMQVQSVIPVGEGALQAAFDKLKRKLADAGYFTIERKRQIPQYVKKIGLITSETADAKRDFLTKIGNFGYSIYFYGVRVEGIKAIPLICGAFEYFNENPLSLDVLVLTRGGGSLESLQAFNSYDIAKAIYSSKIPVISAVGHENDVTIADLVADFRASTPTDAAKILSNDWSMAEQRVQDIENNIYAHFKNVWQNSINHLNYINDSITSVFKFSLASVADRLMIQSDRYENSTKKWIENVSKILDTYENLFSAYDPGNRLKQGYSIVTDTFGKIIKETSSVSVGDIVSIKLFAGSLNAKIEEINK